MEDSLMVAFDDLLWSKGGFRGFLKIIVDTDDRDFWDKFGRLTSRGKIKTLLDVTRIEWGDGKTLLQALKLLAAFEKKEHGAI